MRANGSLWCWGVNGSGTLGNGSTTDRRVPVPITSLGTAAAEVAAGGYHTCARKTDDTLWCWGSNSAGSVGDGSTTDRLLPVQLSSLGSTVAEVTAGGAHSCARTVDGTVWCWGFNGDGQLGDGTLVQRSSPVPTGAVAGGAVEIAAGASHTCERASDQTLRCWGRNADGQLGDGTTMRRTTPTLIMNLAASPTATLASAANAWSSVSLALVLLGCGWLVARRRGSPLGSRQRPGPDQSAPECAPRCPTGRRVLPTT